jgi:hypothetical protein
MTVMKHHLPNLDRRNAMIEVNDVVLYAEDDELMQGKVVYMAEADIAQLVIEKSGEGLCIRYGESEREYVNYKSVYKLS